MAACPPQIVLLGNSITHFWGGEPYEKRRVAPYVWDKLFRGRRAAKQPDARIYVVRILPRRGYEERLARLNDRIADALQASPRTEVIDPGRVLLSRDGRIDESLFSDGLHPNHEG